MILTFDQFLAVERDVESQNDPQAWGDGGRAMGSLQQHPCFIQRWSGHLVWPVDWTWEQVEEAALSAFYQDAVARGVGDADAAAGYNAHGRAFKDDAEEDAAYVARFREAARRLFGVDV